MKDKPLKLWGKAFSFIFKASPSLLGMSILYFVYQNKDIETILQLGNLHILYLVLGCVLFIFPLIDHFKIGDLFELKKGLKETEKEIVKLKETLNLMLSVNNVNTTTNNIYTDDYSKEETEKSINKVIHKDEPIKEDIEQQGVNQEKIDSMSMSIIRDYDAIINKIAMLTNLNNTNIARDSRALYNNFLNNNRYHSVAKDYMPAFDFARNTRNKIAHNSYVTNEELRKASEITKNMLKWLDEIDN